MVQTAVRLSNTLGLNRRTKKVPDLQDWIASHSNEHAEDEDEAQPRSRRVIRSRTIEHDEDDD
jgi:hypothetical protein